jgi:hypothetical protein
MSMERARRDRFAMHTVPLTWEIPAAVTVGVLLLIAATPLVVQGLAAWLVAGTFAWPTNHLGTALTGLVRGQFGEGLAANLAPQLPPAVLMWALTVVGEVVVLGAALVVGLWMRDLVGGSNARHGLATSVQAAEALGLPRLRKSAPVIRPDLVARRRLRRSSGCDQRGNR